MDSDSPQAHAEWPWAALRALAAGLAALALLAHLGRFLFSAAHRVPYAWSLDWTEGLSSLHALDLLRGWPPYHPPHVESVPVMYPPVMAFLQAPFFAAGASGLWPARLVATLATLAAVVLLVRLARREGASGGEAALVGALFLATYDGLDRVLDMGRIDSLALAFFLLGLWFMAAPGRAPGRLPRRVLAGAGAFVLATFTKQSMGLPVLLAYAGRLRRRPREALTGALAYAAGGLVVTGLLELWCGGWFLRWCLGVLSKHPWDPLKTPAVLLGDLAAGLPLALFAGLPTLLVARLLQPRRAGPAGLALPLAGVGLVTISALSRVKVGGHVNGWAFAFAGVALAAACLPAELRRRVKARPTPLARRLAVALHLGVMALGLEGCYRRFTCLEPGLPTPEDAARAERFRRQLRGPEGPLGPMLAPVHPALAELAGCGPQFPLMSVWDYAYAGRTLQMEGLDERMRQKHWRAVLLPVSYASWIGGLRASYAPAAPLDLPAMRAGNVLPEHWLWLPVRPDEGVLRPLLGPRRAGGVRRSPTFTVEADALSLSFEGGGPHAAEALSLVVGGLVRLRSASARGAPLQAVLWDLRPWKGKEARVLLETRHRDGDLEVVQAAFVDVPEALKGFF